VDRLGFSAFDYLYAWMARVEMKTRIRCQHCGEYSEVEDMGCFRCPKCNKFYVSMSEYIRNQIQGEKDEHCN